MAGIDFTYAPDPINPDGKVELVSSLEIYADVPRADGTTEKVYCGIARSMTINERRSIIYNFVIGHKDPSTARDLIPGPIEESTIDMDTMVFFKVNAVGLFSTDIRNPNVPGSRYAASVRYQTKPFTVIEKWSNPTTGNVVYEQSYDGCMIESCQKTASYENTGDLRVLETVRMHYKTTRLTVGEGINDPSLGDVLNS